MWGSESSSVRTSSSSLDHSSNVSGSFSERSLFAAFASDSNEAGGLLFRAFFELAFQICDLLFKLGLGDHGSFFLLSEGCVAVSVEFMTTRQSHVETSGKQQHAPG